MVSACEKVIASACENVIASVDPGGLTINAERINSQPSHGKFKRFNSFFLHVGIKTVYITVYNWHREDQQSLHMKKQLLLCVKRQLPLCMKRQSSLCMKRQLSLHMKRQSHLCMKRWSPLLILGCGSTIDTERINSQLSQVKFKRFNLLFLHVGIKTVNISVYNWHREDQMFLHVKRQLPLCVKRWLPLVHEEVIISVDPGGMDWQSMQRGSTVNFHMENSKDLTYFSCMLVLKLFILLFTINTERINSLCMWKGNHLCMWKGNHLCMWKGNHLCWSWGVWINDWHRED